MLPESRLRGSSPSLELLERLGLFPPENLNAFEVSLEHTRALANEELAETEQEGSARFDRMERDWEKQFKDPDDVFFAAQGSIEPLRLRSHGCEFWGHPGNTKKLVLSI